MYQHTVAVQKKKKILQNDNFKIYIFLYTERLAWK